MLFGENNERFDCKPIMTTYVFAARLSMLNLAASGKRILTIQPDLIKNGVFATPFVY